MTGRYLESDPIGLRGGVGTYGYVGGNPVVRFDPEGKNITTAGGAVVGGFCGGPPGAIAGALLGTLIGAGVVYVATDCGNDCKGGDKDESCGSKYPNHLPCSRLDLFNHDSLRGALVSFGVRNAKLHNPDPLESGLCAGTAGAGTHWNVRVGSGKIGSITSCTCCQNTPEGPKLKTKFRTH